MRRAICLPPPASRSASTDRRRRHAGAPQPPPFSRRSGGRLPPTCLRRLGDSPTRPERPRAKSIAPHLASCTVRLSRTRGANRRRRCLVRCGGRGTRATPRLRAGPMGWVSQLRNCDINHHRRRLTAARWAAWVGPRCGGMGRGWSETKGKPPRERGAPEGAVGGVALPPEGGVSVGCGAGDAEGRVRRGRAG